MPNRLEDELAVLAPLTLPRDQPGTGFWQQISTRATENNWTGFGSAVCSHTDH